MKKPIKPIRPEVPEILKSLLYPESEPPEYLEETIYKTKTNFDIKYEKFIKENPKASQNEVFNYFFEEEGWEIEFLDNGEIYKVCGSDEFINSPNDFDKKEEISLADIIAKVKNEDYSLVRIVPMADYKGDYIYGMPALHIYILRKNPNYKEQLKASKKYKKAMDKSWDLEIEYNKNLELYKKERKEKIDAKIKEMEDGGEI